MTLGHIPRGGRLYGWMSLSCHCYTYYTFFCLLSTESALWCLCMYVTLSCFRFHGYWYLPWKLLIYYVSKMFLFFIKCKIVISYVLLSCAGVVQAVLVPLTPIVRCPAVPPLPRSVLKFPYIGALAKTASAILWPTSQRMIMTLSITNRLFHVWFNYYCTLPICVNDWCKHLIGWKYIFLFLFLLSECG